MTNLHENQSVQHISASRPTAKMRAIRARTKSAYFREADDCFHEIMQEPLSKAKRIGEADIVAGVPFFNEIDTVGHVLTTVKKGLEEFYSDKRCVVVAAGSPAGGDALKVIDALPQSGRIEQIAFQLNDERVNGKGWCIRAIMEIAQTLGADLILLEADLKSRTRYGNIEGLAPDWINLLLEPIQSGKMDMVISRFNRHYFETPASSYLARPLLAAIYNCPVHDLVGGQWGISHTLLRTYFQDSGYPHSEEISGYGVDSWLVTTAITASARICEANLGIKIHRPSAGKTELVLRQIAKVLFDQVAADSKWWQEMNTEKGLPLKQHLPAYGFTKGYQPDKVDLMIQQLIVKYKRGFNKFHSLYKATLPEETYMQLEELTGADGKRFNFPSKLWVQVVYHFLLAYAFGKEFAKDDLLNSLIHLHNGYTAGFATNVHLLQDMLTSLPAEEQKQLVSLEAEKWMDDLVEEFLSQKPIFLASWEITAEALKPILPQITYREFIPGVPLVVPSEITTPEGKTVRANDIYDSIFAQQKAEFESFVYERLEIPREASPREIALSLKDFLHMVEETIPPDSDLSTIKGTREMVDFVFDNFPHQPGFCLIPEMASWLLNHYPPYTLPMKLGHADLAEMFREYDPLTILALASWSEEREYVESVWALIRENIRSEHFAPCTIKPLVVSHANFPSLVEMKDSSDLNKLTSHIVVSNLHKGMGGEFPKLRYLTILAKNIVEAEAFGTIWQQFARERKMYGRKIINSLEGHWGGEPLSAHSIFEDRIKRAMAERLHQMAQKIIEEADGVAKLMSLAKGIKAIADSYHLALILPDGTFVTCSAWSWASYSFKGGKELPPPLSLHVERDWTSHEFLVKYFKAAGGREGEIEEKIIELMEQGRESEDLAPILLGTEKEAMRVIPAKMIVTEQPPAGRLHRFADNPILEPIKEHPWESKYVLNAATIRLNGHVYLSYRAVGEDEISRLGLAISKDGFKFTERLDKPIFEPKAKSEAKGCEDPRFTLIDDRIYMLYTAYDGIVAQIAMASIGIKDFTNQHWSSWHRHGLVFPGFDDKDAAMFPEQFNGKFAMLHRVDPHMWVTFSPHLRCPWPRKEHKILTGSTSGMMWDGRKIGAGAQPIKTKYGWLLITHGVDYKLVYRLGIMLLKLDDPTKLIYRSPNFVLEPSDRWELGEGDDSWVPNVVFTCGALSREDHKEMLDADDDLIVYYGASDTVMNIATAQVKELVPEDFRH